MIELKLKYKGYPLTIVFPRNTYYNHFEVSRGKTIYHILFGELVDGKGLTPNQLVAKYKKQCPFLRDSLVRRMIGTIEYAVSKSPEKRVRALRFIKRKRGERGPSLVRRSVKGRYTAVEIKIIEAVSVSHTHKSINAQRDEVLRRFVKKGITSFIAKRPKRLRRCP